MKILITGGAGFIGSHLCDKYTKDNHTVICLDNFISGDLMNIRHLLDYRKFKLIKGDIRDSELVESLVRDVDVVFHLAALVHVDKSYVEPRLTYEINVMGTQNVLEAAKRHDPQKVIFASTSEVYGSALHVPIREDHPLNAPHPYGASKIAADRMCNAYNTTYGMDISIVRSFNVFGPRQRNLGYGGVISIFARKVFVGASPIIFGDGKQTRDYTYVDDTVTAYDLVLKHKKPLVEPINFGNGKEITIKEIADKIIKLSGNKKIKPVYVSPRIGEVKRLIADTSKAEKILKWKPKCNLKDGLASYVEWYKNYGFESRITL